MNTSLLYLRTLGFRRPSYLIPDRKAGPYSLISSSPPVFYLKYWMDESYRLQYCFEDLWQGMRRHSAYFLCSWRWWIEDPVKISVAKRFEDAHRRRYPKHHFVHLCNTMRQYELFHERGFDAIFCNQNCLVDDSIFRPLAGVHKTFDAVYDARLKRYKRHALAAKIEKLALIYDFSTAIDDPRCAAKIRHQFSGAHFFNHERAGTYNALTPLQVNRRLNACRVGLCLSRREGAMYASMQYMLAGLPIVSTRSEGGRDVFFDDSFTVIVDDDPGAVRKGVDELISRDIPPHLVRHNALERAQLHRGRLISLVQRIYDSEGVNRNFELEWNHIFFNKLFRENQSHEQTMEALARLRWCSGS